MVIKVLGWIKLKNKPMHVTRQLIAQRKPLTSKWELVLGPKSPKLPKFWGQFLRGNSFGATFVRDQVIDGELTNS